MKPILLWIIFFGMIDSALVNCFAATDETICEPVTKPPTVYNECNNGLTRNDADKIIETTAKSFGVLTITNYELGNLIPNDKTWFESMDFEVKIYMPAE